MFSRFGLKNSNTTIVLTKINQLLEFALQNSFAQKGHKLLDLSLSHMVTPQ